MEVAQAGGGALEAFVGADNADVIPHEAADFVPVVVNHDEFVHILHPTRAPLRQVEFGSRFALAGGFLESAMGQDESLQKRIAGQAIRAMQTGAGHFPNGIKAAQAGFAIEIGLHSAALIVSGRNDRDGLGGDVDAVAETGLVNGGEPAFQKIRRLVRDVEKDALAAAAFHFGVNGPGHNVAGCQLLLRVVVFHEPPALGVEEDSALAPHGLGNKEGLGLGMEKAGGMKLNELHVGDHGPGPPGHGHPVAGRHIRVGGIKINLAASSGGQHDGVAAKRLDLTGGFVENVNPHTAILHGVTQLAGCQKIHRHVVFQHGDSRMVGDAVHQGALDFESGRVLKMQHPPFGVAAFFPQIEFALPILAVPLVKVHAQFHQARDAFGSLGDDRADGLLVTEPRSRHQRVADVKIKGILLADHASHPALGPRGIRIHRAAFCHQGHGSLLRRLEGVG